MPSAPYLVPPLLLIATLLVSAVAKIRDPRDTSSVFLRLGLPRALLRLRVPRLLPYGELVLAALLLVAPGRWYVVPASASLLLFAAYFLVILRAVRLPYPVSCACFGRLGLGEVTRRTLVRNAVLLALALVTWADSWRGHGVAQRVGDLGGGAWWPVAVALVALGCALVVAARRAAPYDDQDDQDDPTAYRPVPAPDGVLHGPDGPVGVWQLSDAAARLLVFCDPSRDARLVAETTAWATRLSPVRVHVVTSLDRSEGPAPDLLTDPGDAYRHRLGVDSPGAVLLGTDRMLAGGPVAGADEIAALVDAVAAELRVPDRPTP